MAETFSTPSSHVQNFGSGLKKTLPRIWGHHHQLDDQDKEHLDGQLTTINGSSDHLYGTTGDLKSPMGSKGGQKGVEGGPCGSWGPLRARIQEAQSDLLFLERPDSYSEPESTIYKVA